MARRIFRRYLPDPDRIRKHKHLRFLGERLHQPHLWHLNRHSVPRAFAVGLFWALMPMPMQTIPAAAIAFYVRANMPLTLVLVWLTNPFTTPPVLYFCYWVGTLILGTPAEPITFEISFAWLGEQFLRVWQPIVLGCFVVATAAALIGYYGIRRLWRWHVLRDWERRRVKRGGTTKRAKSRHRA